MPLPTLSKTWQLDVNNAITSSPGGLLFAIKNLLKGFALNPWVVDGSSDGATGAMDGVDRWSAGPGEDYWIVLRQVATGLRICLQFFPDTFGDDDRALDVVMATAPFTGGTATTRPTAAGESVLQDTTEIWTISLIGASAVHAWHSDDGLFTYVSANSALGTAILWAFGRPLDPSEGWEDPVVAYTKPALLTRLMKQANIGWNYPDATSTLGGAGEGIYNNLELVAEAAPVANEISGEWPMQPVFLYCRLHPKGIHGRLPDLFIVPDVKAGSAIPDASAQFMAFESVALPWDGSALLSPEA